MYLMVKHMKVWIGLDYERGLKIFKEFIETGAVASKVNIDGVEDTQALPFVGIANSCSFEDIDSVMQEDFIRLMSYIEDNNLTLNTPPFTLYETFNPAKKHTHTGRYENLGSRPCVTLV